MALESAADAAFVAWRWAGVAPTSADASAGDADPPSSWTSRNTPAPSATPASQPSQACCRARIPRLRTDGSALRLRQAFAQFRPQAGPVEQFDALRFREPARLRGEGAGRDQQAAHGAAHAHGVREFADVAGTEHVARAVLGREQPRLAVAFERDVGLVRGGARVVHAGEAAPGEHVEDQVDELAPAHVRERGDAFGAFLARQAHALQVDGRGHADGHGDDDREQETGQCAHAFASERGAQG